MVGDRVGHEAERERGDGQEGCEEREVLLEVSQKVRPLCYECASVSAACQSNSIEIFKA